MGPNCALIPKQTCDGKFYAVSRGLGAVHEFCFDPGPGARVAGTWRRLDVEGAATHDTCWWLQGLEWHAGRLWAFGGDAHSSPPRAEVWAVDPTARAARLAWELVKTVGPGPKVRRDPASALVAGRWIVQGGRRTDRCGTPVGGSTADCHAFDFKAREWSHVFAVGGRLTTRDAHAAVGMGDCVVFAGGQVCSPGHKDGASMPLAITTASTPT